MNTAIDFKSSIEKQKVVFEESLWEKLLGKLFWYTLLLSFPLLSILILIVDAKKEGIKGAMDIIFFVTLANLIPYLIFNRLIKMQKLKKVQGVNQQINRSITKELSKKQNWQILIDNKTCLLAMPDHSFFTWSRQFLIIYHQNEILFNCMTFGSFGLLSPFHFLSDQKEENQFLIEFESKTKNVQNNID